MLKKLKIKNFQSHKDTELEFSPGVNIIVGSTDSGKSAIIRALVYLIQNRPQGEAIRSTWGGDTAVEVTTEKDYTILRIRTNSENKYRVKDYGTFEAIRTDVPVEVQTLLNFNEINLQQQLDRPFLISNTSGEVAQHFNKVADLGVIDLSRKNIEKWLSEITAEIKSKTNQLKEFEEELKNYTHLEKFEIEVEVLEGMEQRALSLRTSKQSLSTLIMDIAEIEEEIEEKSEILKFEKDVDLLIDKINERDALKEEENNLTELITEIVTSNNNISEGKRKLTEMEETFEREMPEICPLCNQKIL